MSTENGTNSEENEHSGDTPDYLNNGMVTLKLAVGDPVTDLGIRTDRVEVEFEKSFVTSELADHLWYEYNIDVDDYDVEVRE